MAIRRLKVSNFRSFNELDIELGDFNVLIGANASGKSNFVEVFRFLRDIRNHGLHNAIALQGGKSFVQNLRLGASRPLSIRIEDDQDVGFAVRRTDRSDAHVAVEVHGTTYGFSLDASAQNGRVHKSGWHILSDDIMRMFSAYSLVNVAKNRGEVKEKLGDGKLLAWWDDGILHIDSNVDPSIKDPYLDSVELIPFELDWFPSDLLLIESNMFPALLSGRPNPPFGTVNELGIYRIDTRASQLAQPVRASASLTEGATNLAPILDRILSNQTHRKTLLNLVRFLLPFIDDIGVQNLTNDSLLPYVTETYTDQAELYAGLMSEGTIAAITLVVIFYFEERPLVILEDPDRGMHPKLMSRVVEMMKEVSKERQIIVTTHHPEMVRYAGVENLLLVSRDENGFSQITRPADKTMVKRFLENDIGIDELYVDDLLEV